MKPIWAEISSKHIEKSEVSDSYADFAFFIYTRICLIRQMD